MHSSFLNSINKQFQYYKMLGDKTFDQIPEDKLHWSPVEGSNSIADLVKHVRGNMLSRWTDFLTSDGEKEWRKRDEEFFGDFSSRAEMKKAWEEGWKVLFKAIDPLQEEDLEKLVYIRNQGHTVTEALNRQLAHYAYHVGQVVFLGTLICGEDWVSLSIPKGDSKKFNAERFSKEKAKGHFINDVMGKGPDLD